LVKDRLDLSRVHDGSVRDLLRRHLGRRLARVRWETEILGAPPDVAHVLRITPGMLVVANIATDYLDDGLPVQSVAMYYRVDRVKFCFTGDF
jgi:DNA-binding GntR family transcriptional regulator